MKTLKISEELHQDIKKYCADNSKNVQDIVEDKLSELVHKEFNIGTMQIIGTNIDNITFNMNKDSVVTLMELFKKLILNKPLDNVDIITDLVKSVKDLEFFISEYNKQLKEKTFNEEFVQKFEDTQKSHLGALQQEIVKTLEEKEKKEEEVLSKGKVVQVESPEDISNMINETVKLDVELDTSTPLIPSLSEGTLKSIAFSIGIDIEDEEKFEAMKNVYDKHIQVANGERKKAYDILLDNIHYDVKEYINDTKVVLLSTSSVLEPTYQEKTVEGFNVLKRLNPSSGNYNDIIENIKPMYHVLQLPKKLKEFTENEMGNIEDCKWIYNLDNKGDYFIVNTENTIDIISKEETSDDMFVKPNLLGKYMKAIKK